MVLLAMQSEMKESTFTQEKRVIPGCRLFFSKGDILNFSIFRDEIFPNIKVFHCKKNIYTSFSFLVVILKLSLLMSQSSLSSLVC